MYINTNFLKSVSVKSGASYDPLFQFEFEVALFKLQADKPSMNPFLQLPPNLEWSRRSIPFSQNLFHTLTSLSFWTLFINIRGFS